MKPAPGYKSCCGCDQDKPFTEFHAHRNNKDGYQNHCIPCQRKWSKANKPKIKEYQRRYHAKYKARTRDRRLRKTYGISQADYARLLVEQNGGCASCNVHAGGELLNVDHCHKSGKVRALLCRNCNLAIGYLKDSPWKCISLLKYLIAHEL